MAESKKPGGVTQRKRNTDDLPELVTGLDLTTSFFERLSYYAQRPVAYSLPTGNSCIADLGSHPKFDELVDLLVTLEPEMSKTLDALRAWTPPPTPMEGTSFAAFYARLAEAYVHNRDQLRIYDDVPGPLDGRHPGFELTFNPADRRLKATEKPDDRFQVPPLSLEISVPRQPGDRPHLAYNWVFRTRVDAWEVFALRAILIALHERTDPCIERIASDAELGRPQWQHALEHITTYRSRVALAPAENREWTFCLTSLYQEQYQIAAFSRSPKKTKTKGASVSKFRKHSFDALLSDEAASAVERDIARLALCTLTSAYGRGEATLTLGTAQGHELAKRLAEHPRVVLAGLKAHPEDAQAEPVTVLAGKIAMRLDPVEDGSGALVPRFLIGDAGDYRELSIVISKLHGREGSIFRGGRVDDHDDDSPTAKRTARLISVEIPVALGPWIETSDAMEGTLAFPSEALPRLLVATAPLVERGTVQLPRRALGAEVSFQPQSSLRVEWGSDRDDGERYAQIELMITPHPGAPMIEAAGGPRLFTFIRHTEQESERVFVERDYDEEDALTRATAALMRREVPAVAWSDHRGHTTSLEGTLALAQWLDRNPLGLPIEIKLGQPPTRQSWESLRTRLRVGRKNRWLEVSMDAKDGSVSLGEVLEAARHARRFVKAREGVFIELSDDAIAKFQALAAATDLRARTGDNAGEEQSTVTLNDAFGVALAEAATLFTEVDSSVDLEMYRARFEERLLHLDDDALPKLDHGELRPYQKEGIAWILRLASWAPGCVLADDMGLGKTIQTAAILKARAHLGPALVIAPASVASNWTAELARFVPSIASNVRVISYGLLQRQVKEAAPGSPHTRYATVVADEAQYVKNTGAQRSDAVRSLDRDFTIALTGTPLENHLGELWSIVDIVFPGLLGDEARFREQFRRPIEGDGRDPHRLAALARLLGPFLLRRTRRAVLEELPPREEITEYLELGPEETRRYLALRQACENELRDEEGRVRPMSQMRIALLTALTRLRQLACDVRLVDPTYDGPPSTKITRTLEIARELASEGNRMLIFSQFTSFLSKVRDELATAGLRVGYLSGETPSAKRRAIVDAFQAGEHDAFCISLLAGGTGLNLTNASYVIHLDPWWNPAAEEQATSRAHRMGQTNPVTVYRLVARGTIEEAVLALHDDKRDLASAVLEGKSDAQAGPLSSKELLELLRFGG